MKLKAISDMPIAEMMYEAAGFQKAGKKTTNAPMLGSHDRAKGR